MFLIKLIMVSFRTNCCECCGGYTFFGGLVSIGTERRDLIVFHLWNDLEVDALFPFV